LCNGFCPFVNFNPKEERKREELHSYLRVEGFSTRGICKVLNIGEFLGFSTWEICKALSIDDF
jgi:hypothetical protein